MKYRILIAATALLFPLAASLLAQGARGGGQAPQTARAAAPIDLTGYWVSIVTEDWRFRMVTPPKGDFASIPTNPAGVQVGQQWDPAKDEAAGEQCKSYGAPAIMRVPGRIHITWANDTTLRSKPTPDSRPGSSISVSFSRHPALQPGKEIQSPAGKLRAEAVAVAGRRQEAP